ncbi:homoserine kinase, partial [Angustibacter peucedani]
MPPSSVRVRVSATSANLGPGFDSLGLALGLHDEVEVRLGGAPGARVQVVGEGAGEVGEGDEHLVVRAVRVGLAAAGHDADVVLDLLCRNEIPHGRGLGSSAAAVVAGLVAARGLTGDVLDDDRLLALATDLEGHPDNAAAALLGGLTLAWTDADGPRAVRLEPHPDVAVLVLVPTSRLATHHARSVLPASVTHEDAAANSARAALLVHALTTRPELLLPATEDRLHQRQRSAAMPETVGLVDRLRADGRAAVVSGAGPSVLVLGPRGDDAWRPACAAAAGP